MSNKQIKIPTYIANKFPQKVNMQNLETLASVRNINFQRNHNGNSIAVNKPIPMPRFGSKGYNFITIKGNIQQSTGQSNSKTFNNTKNRYIEDPEIEQQDNKNQKEFSRSSCIFSSQGLRKENYLNTQLIEQLQGVKKQLELKQNQIIVYRQDKEKFNEKIRILSSELSSSQQYCKSLENQLKLKKAELAELQITLKNISSSLQMQQLQHQKQQVNFNQELKEMQTSIVLLQKQKQKLLSQSTLIAQELSYQKKQRPPKEQPHKNDEPLLKQISQLKQQLVQQKDRNQQLALANSLIQQAIENLDKTLKCQFRKSGKLENRILNLEIIRQNYDSILQYTNQQLFGLKLRNINAKYTETKVDDQQSSLRNSDHYL